LNRRHGTSPISSDTDLIDSKKAFRKEAADRRRAFVETIEPEAAAMALGANIYGIFLGKPAGTVTGYLAIADEIDPQPAMTVLAQVGWCCALPVVMANGQPLEFRAWRPGDALADGPLRTRHPANGDAVDPDVLLVPMLAFDKRGMRMGWGGGFYDRTIAGLRARNPNVLAIGVAFSGQGVKEVPSGPHDAVLDAVATEADVQWFRGQA
jgi:5-formyltetrahydrofolate cyclo-ligase